MRKYLVVGANSFSGSHFVSHLLEQGHDVVGLSRSPEPTFPFLPRLWSTTKGSYTFMQVDLNAPSADFCAELSVQRPQVVVNFAAQGMVAQSWDAPWDWFQTNTVALSRFLQQLMELPSLEKYVHISTPEVYGSTDGWIKESWEFRPSTPYATSRAAGDWHVANLANVKGLSIVLTRAANVYGPGQQLYRVIPRAFLSGILGERFPLHGSGESTRSFIHIRDVVDATYRLAEGDFAETVFHISTNELVSIRSLVDAVARVLGGSPSLELENLPERDGKDFTYQLDSTLLRGVTGWSDTISLEQGLFEVHDWAIRHLNELRDLPRNYVHKV